MLTIIISLSKFKVYVSHSSKRLEIVAESGLPDGCPPTECLTSNLLDATRPARTSTSVQHRRRRLPTSTMHALTRWMHRICRHVTCHATWLVRSLTRVLGASGACVSNVWNSTRSLPRPIPCPCGRCLKRVEIHRLYYPGPYPVFACRGPLRTAEPEEVKVSQNVWKSAAHASRWYIYIYIFFVVVRRGIYKIYIKF